MSGLVRRTARPALASVLACLALLLGAATASAHSYFMQSDPPDGSILERAPARILLVFSSPVAAEFTNIDLVTVSGGHYSPASVRSYPGKPNIVVVSLPEIPTGSYRLSFATRDSVDLHQTAGTIVFGVGEAPGSPGVVPSTAPARPSEFVLRWLALAGLAAVLGGITFSLLVAARLPEPPAVRALIQRVLLGLALAGSGLVLVAQTGLLALQATSLGPVLPSVGRLLAGSEYGVRWLVTVLLVAGVAALLSVLWARARRGEVPGLLQQVRELRAWALLSTQFRLVLLALALTVAMAFSGHVAGPSGTSAGGVMLVALHVGAMCVWAGGLIALGLALMVVRRARGQLRRSSVMALVVGFGPIAAIAFATLAATGLLLSGMQVSSVTALLSTEYGAVLVGKVALIGLVALFGLRHALWTWRGLAPHGQWPGRVPRKLPLTVALEASGAILVVLLAAVLSASAPARGPQFDAPSASQSVTQVSREQDGLLVTLSVKPNRAGPNLIGVHVVSTRRPALAPVQGVTVTVLRPDDVPQVLATSPNGSRYDAGTVKLAAGDVRITVSVQRAGLADLVATVHWQVAAAEIQLAPVVVSNQRLAPIVDVIAMVVVVIAATLVIAGWVRHRRAARRRPTMRELLERARRYNQEQWGGDRPRLWRRSDTGSAQERSASRPDPTARAS